MTTALTEAIDQADTPPAGPTLGGLLQQMAPEFDRALPRHIDVDRFTRMALTTVRLNPTLLECDPASVLGGFMQAATLGLEIADVRGQAYLIPRRVKGQMQATFQLGYRGLIDLAWRSGISVDQPVTVRAGERFEVRLGTSSEIVHDWRPEAAAGEPVAYYAVARFPDGRHPQFAVMSRVEVEAHRDKFAGTVKDKSPWVEHFDAMAHKTVIKRLLNPLPLAAEFTGAVSADDRVSVVDMDTIGTGTTITVVNDDGDDADE